MVKCVGGLVDRYKGIHYTILFYKYLILFIIKIKYNLKKFEVNENKY